MAFVVGALRPTIAGAQTCGTDYTIKEGKTLAQIAARIYGDPWAVDYHFLRESSSSRRQRVPTPSWVIAEIAVHRRIAAVAAADRNDPDPPS